MTLEKIIFGATNNKEEIPNKTINGNIKTIVEERVYENIAIEHETQPGEEKMAPQICINQPLDGIVASLSHSSNTTGTTYTQAFVTYVNPGDSVHLTDERELATHL